MVLIEGIEQIREPFNKAVITIGNFDGVHIGHQALFHEVIEKADAIGGTSVAMTFEPHPIRVLKMNGHPPLITIYEQKKELIEKTGIDVLICIPFTRDFAGIDADDFIENILVEKIGTRAVVVGKDYSFGKGRKGDIELLRKKGGQFGFEVIVADWIQTPKVGHGRISSTAIREFVMDGKVAEAGKYLGRFYQIRGIVQKGRDRGGKLLGFPTANIQLHDELAPKMGVYAVTVECLGQTFEGVANIGFSPTFDDHLYTVEVHILDFDSSIYDSTIRVNFVRRIREEKKFSGIDALSDQIRNDITVAREILKSAHQ